METRTSSIDLSRRGFLKLTGATGTLAVLGGGILGGRGSHLLSTALAATKPQEGEWHYTYCRMCMRGDCAAQYKIVNGVVTEVKGNPASPTNKGTLCPRGLTLIQNLYNPYRVKAPVKRTNPKKGLDQDPGWVEISWDEALDTVAKKFKAIHDKDPRGLLVNLGFGGMDYFTSFIPYVPASFHTPNLITTNGALCSVHYATELVQSCFPVAIADFAYCEYNIALGRTVAGNIGAANGETRGMLDALKRGMKLVVVDPRSSPDASKGEWVPIRPGTDLAFMLGLINTVLYEVKTIDTDFLTNRTNGPYLIRADGSYLRNAAGKPQVIDARSGKTTAFDAPGVKPLLEGQANTPAGDAKTGFTLMKESMKEYTPEWAEKQSTVPAATIRRIAKEFVGHAHIGETITLNGVTMPFRPVSVLVNRGSINHADGTVTDLSTKILNELVGALDVPGSCLACIHGPLLKPDADGTVEPAREAVGEPFSYPPQSLDLSQYYPYRHSMPFQAYRSVLEPEKYGLTYKVEGALVIGGNVVTSLVEPDLMAKAVASIPFVTTIGYHFDEMAALSDIVMPDHAMLERMAVNVFETTFGAIGPDTLGLRMVMMRDPAPPTYNTRLSQDIVMQIWQRIGLLPIMLDVMNHAGIMMGEITMAHLPPDLQLDPTKVYTIEEIWDRGLQATTEPGKGVDWFKQNGIWTKFDTRDKCYNYTYFPMGKTRYQIYFEGLRTGGQKLRQNLEKNNVKLPGVDFNEMFAYYDPIPKWRETPLMKEMRLGPKDFDLLGINFKMALSNFRLGGQDQLPWLTETGEKLDPLYNSVCLNPRVAAAKGLQEGQMVWVESKYGKTRGRLHISEMFHPDSVGIGGALGRMVSTLGKAPTQRTHFNQLLGAPLNTIDPIAGGVENTVRVKVYAA